MARAEPLAYLYCAAPLGEPKSEVHCGQRFAAMGIGVQQNGQSFVVGAAGTGAGLR